MHRHRLTEGSLVGHHPEPTAPIKVLLVDDDPDVRQLLVNAISALGHSPMEAENGTR
jgi:CheY-like chemotaxis protein